MFIYEELSDGDFAALVKLYPEGHYLAGQPAYQTIDHASGMKLIALGGRGNTPESHHEPPDFYVFIWNGKVVSFESRYTMTYPQNECEIRHTIGRISIPLSLKDSESVLLDAVRQALRVYWSGLRFPRRVSGLSAEFLAIRYVG